MGRPLRRFSMADDPRITVEELKRRMDAGEDFTVIDVRNPGAWAESDTVIPEAIRVPLNKLEASLPRIPKSKPVVAQFMVLVAQERNLWPGELREPDRRVWHRHC
jgi:hypothetical protein